MGDDGLGCVMVFGIVMCFLAAMFSFFLALDHQSLEIPITGWTYGPPLVLSAILLLALISFLSSERRVRAEMVVEAALLWAGLSLTAFLAWLMGCALVVMVSYG